MDAVAVQELFQTAITGIVTVSLIALLFIPHFSAVLFIFPLITILYVDMLGVLQLAGSAINAVSYISLTMSIGLLVDFLMHILLRYYETNDLERKEKVKRTLKTMGSSVLIGATSTFVGVVPLAFSQSEIFSTIFVTFLGLVTLGAGHGLILLPALLNLCGPKVCIQKDDNTSKDQTSSDVTSEILLEQAKLEDGYRSNTAVMEENNHYAEDEMECSC